MGSGKKTDNKSLELKCALRRRLIRDAGLTDLRVLDLCAGAGNIWRDMARTHKISHYVPVDQEPRMPRTIKAAIPDRLLSAFDMSAFNAVDVDTYGEPSAAWLNTFPRIQNLTAFFHTHGMVSGMGRCKISTMARKFLGIPLEWNIPRKRDLALMVPGHALTRPADGVEIVRGWKINLPNVGYCGLICGPKGAKEHRRKNRN